LDEGAEWEDAVDRLEEELSVFHRRSRRFLRSFAGRVHPEIDASTYAVLVVIAQRPVRMIDLAEEFGLDKSTMSRHVSALIGLGLVRRDPDPNDRRAYLLSPTDVGRERLESAVATRRGQWRGRLNGWTAADLDSFVAALTRLNTDLDPL
jgi:DNA-binding MarR family transcriptional regulator